MPPAHMAAVSVYQVQPSKRLAGTESPLPSCLPPSKVAGLVAPLEAAAGAELARLRSLDERRRRLAAALAGLSTRAANLD
jgi:hypothetical protein